MLFWQSSVIGILFVTPFVVPLDLNYGSRSLDGLAYLDTTHPGHAGGVAYLRHLPGDDRIVEAVGGDYTYYSRISSFTGIPSIIGEPFHEFMWRGDTTGWFRHDRRIFNQSMKIRIKRLSS